MCEHRGRDTNARVFAAWVVLAIVAGTALILGSSPVLTGIGVVLVILGLISLMPTLRYGVMAPGTGSSG